jgi:beta-glucosidase
VRRAASLSLSIFACVGAWLAGCAKPAPGPPTLEERVEAYVAKMTLGEKVAQMHGSTPVPLDNIYPTPDDPKVGLPGFHMVDGPRGVHSGTATTFPVGMARGATWDPSLEQQVGEAIGLEAAAKGANVILAPTINLLRHPAWGRAQETYGEDTVLVGAMGVAFIEGAQQHVIASVKHFAVYSIEDTRFTVDVTVDERSLREQYLPHFRKAVQQGRAASVMTAYNSVNGHWCSENTHLLRDILDGEWGFDGFVESDWVLGTHSTVEAANAGLDVEMPTGEHFGDGLVEAVTDGGVPMSVIDDAVRRIVRKKLELHLDAPPSVDAGVVESPEHVALTLQVEREAAVLLKNASGALPFDRATLGSLAVVGPLADTINLGDTMSSNSTPSHAVTPLAGLMDRASGLEIRHVAGPTLSGADQTAIGTAGAAVVVLGLTAQDEGELSISDSAGGDRHDLSLRLSMEQESLVQTVASLNPRTVVVLEGGSAIVVRPWVDLVQGLVMAWYPGEEGGHAIADVLFGDVNPSGKLPLSVPRAASDLPPFVNDAPAVTYAFLHGYRWLDAMNVAPEFPFGFGLSYTTFSYANLKVDKLAVSFDVKNTGTRAGDEIAQVYVSAKGSSVMRALRDLKAFARLHLEPGETKTVSVMLDSNDLAFWSGSGWSVEPLMYEIDVGGSSRDLPLSAMVALP